MCVAILYHVSFANKEKKCVHMYLHLTPNMIEPNVHLERPAFGVRNNDILCCKVPGKEVCFDGLDQQSR